MAGGGGDGGYEKKQAEIERKKQLARDQLNVMFGVGPSGSAPSRSQFTSTRTVTPTVYGGSAEDTPSPVTETVFDRRGYQSALDRWNSLAPESEKNKAAREALYGTVRQNAFDAGRRRVDEQKDQAQRNLKFELFARGLAGGSEDINQNALLGRTYDQGILDLGAKADAAKTDMMSNDEQTRLGLLQSIDAGMDQGSALSSAIQQMRVNADRAASEAAGTAVGDLFSGAGLLYENSQASKGKQAAQQDWWNTYNPSGRGRNSSYTGTISRV